MPVSNMKTALIFLFVILPICHGAVRDTHRRSKTPHNTNSILRYKRSAPCRYWQEEFRCNDGTCVTVHRKCDGVVDCPDGSDETHYLCRDIRCPDYYFRCTYGACIDKTAMCNGISECADSSDELHVKCRNIFNVIGGQFQCDDGNLIELYLQCDGIFHCGDGSDETSVACAGVRCPVNFFQCAYGACIDSKALCNNTVECLDGSDEEDIVCNRKERKPINYGPAMTSRTDNQHTNMCKLPPHPKNGMFIKNGASHIYKPGTLVKDFYLNVTCQPGYKVVGIAEDDVVICVDGLSNPKKLPTCVRACKLEESPSIEYRCLVTEKGINGTRDCDKMEVEGTAVVPKCSTPNYYSSIALPNMYCVDGQWNYEPKCEAECGTLTPRVEPLVVGGKFSERGEIPWHATIYKKISSRNHHQFYQQICGGSLISRSIIISAAHCFWQEQHGQIPSEKFAVAVGNLYRQWNHPLDEPYVQRSQIEEIIPSSHYRGSDLNYENDIAVVKVKHPFTYKPYIRPLCLDFSISLNENLRRHGAMGTVAGFGLTKNHEGSESPILKVVNMLYVPFDECFKKTPVGNAEFLSDDKFCAGFGNGTAVCKGDSGGGWAYPTVINGTLRYFLGGVVSTSPYSSDGSVCNKNALTSYSDVYYHRDLIRRYLMP